MSTDIGVVKGLIELQDDFTSQLGLAEVALGNFTKHNQESLKAVAGAAGLVTAAFGLVALATIELGKRGADINDVEQTLEHFSGSAKNANDIMTALRDGTKGTVDNFILAKDAAHLLSAGVKLTADDFGILGQAAFVLQNRGLGGTKEQLELVSDALVTGRTKALAMSLGVIDAGDVEQKFAQKLGITKNELSLSGIAEAKRIAVMGMLKAAVKDAGVQERDFGEQLEAARTTVTNFVDDTAKAVAQSPVFAAGMKAMGAAFTETFGSDHNEMIKTTVHWIEQVAITAIDFAQGAITTARVFEGAWYGIKMIVLGVTTAIVGSAAIALQFITAIAQAGAALHVIPQGVADEVKDLRQQFRGMTLDLASQTAEAAKGVLGHTAFDVTLDKLGATLGGVRKAMSDASTAEEKNAEVTNATKKSAEGLAGASGKLTAGFIDQEKVQVILIKSSKELSGIWDDYAAAVAKNSGTSGQQQRAEIEATFNKQVAALDALDPLFKAKYAAYAATADEALKGISSDWASVRDQSIEGLQEQADKAYKTYNEMINSSLHFTRDALDAQLQKYRDLQEAANGWSTKHVAAVQTAANAIQLLDHAWVTDADIAAATINKTTIMVKTLSGELISLAEAEKRQHTGGSYDVTSQNFDQTVRGMSGITDINAAYRMAKQGYSLQEILEIMQRQANGANGPVPPPRGPRIPGFKDGGTVDIMVGENGPEAMRVPLGTQVFPTGTRPGGGFGSNVTNNFYVNGTASDVARKISEEIMRTLKSQAKFGAA